MKKNCMLTPGPTMVPHEVLLAEAAPMVHHRTKEFSAFMAETAEGLKKLFGTQQDVYILAGSGTAGMEAAVANVCSPGDKMICAVGGKFGERWAELGRAFGCEVVEIPIEWGRSFEPEQARDALRAHPDARALYVTHSETSTGALSDVKAIAQLTRETPTLLAVDSITGVGVHPVKMDEWGLDIVVSGSQKGCMMAPGLAFIAVSPRTWDAVKACQSPRYYLDLTAARRNWEKLGTAFTAPVSLVHALRRALEMIFDEGLDQVFERHARLARAARAAVQALGLRLLAERPANGVTAAYVPDGMSSSRLIALMRDKHGVTMADGQGDLKGRIIRIGHMGYVSEGDLLVGLAALEAGLREMGHAIELGGGLRAAQEALA
ncbi:MAG: alanine--glyoxylate aminotransferase family protein [Candidatus Brocadiaceae bacterium]|nr:alanine--glyoxylate aminotransferase family protein [Candidatus Brocadiaceae bacterium]